MLMVGLMSLPWTWGLIPASLRQWAWAKRRRRELEARRGLVERTVTARGEGYVVIEELWDTTIPGCPYKPMPISKITSFTEYYRDGERIRTQRVFQHSGGEPR